MDQHGAIEKLFKDNHRALYALSYNIVKDYDAAKDVVQDVFLQFWKSRNRLDLDAGIKSYLYKATINLSLNYAKRSKRTAAIKESYEYEELVHEQDPYQEAVSAELQQKINRAIAKLPEKCRTIFLMSRYNGMKYQEIAETMGLSQKTVENQMGIALKKLREDLVGYMIVASAILLAGIIYFMIFS